MKNRNDHENACARVAARFRSRLLHQYVVRKIRSDPAYPAVYESVRASRKPLLDVGCGLGLLAYYLRERGFENAIVGLDRDARKISAAQPIASAYGKLELSAEDLRETLPSFSGNVAILDVLHYLTPTEQNKVLPLLAERVAPGAVLVLRDCPRDSNVRYWLTYLAEKFSQLISWNVATPIHFPERDSIAVNFPAHEFAGNGRPLWGGTPFNNHLFVFRRRGSATVAAAE